jgi:hypothetical protein
MMRMRRTIEVWGSRMSDGVDERWLCGILDSHGGGVLV